MRSSSTAAESSSPRRARRRRTSPHAAAHTPPPPPSQLVSLFTRHYPARDTSRTGHRRLLCPNVPMPRAGLLCVVRHAHRSLRREQQRRLPLHFEVPCDEVGGLARAPRTSHLALATFAHASRLNAARARRTLHATHPTPHAARRTPHAARLFSPCGRSCWRSDASGRPRACSSSTTTSSVATRAWASRSGTLVATLGIAR